MKKFKKNSRYGRWKNYKRPSFNFYFVFVVVLITLVVVGVSNLILEWVGNWFENIVNISPIVIILPFSLIVGCLMSFFIGKVLLNPIEKLQTKMNAVTEGDLSVYVEEKNAVEEIENINHSFNIMVKELNSTYAMQQDFVSNVSHEFKTPLNAIEGYATLLQDKSITEEERNEYVMEILSTTKTMTDLVGNMLLLSKINNQAIDYKKDTFFVDEIIRKVVVLLEPKWSEKKLEFDVELQEISILSNEVLMQNVFRNLIENAIKFSPDNGKITLLLYEEDKKMIFSVEDEGEGVPEEGKEHIFEKFYQADTSHKQEGSGLGLPLVKEILKTFNGEISYENVLPTGCKFTVKIPR